MQQGFIEVLHSTVVTPQEVQRFHLSVQKVAALLVLKQSLNLMQQNET
jgi:hypothetical protein